MTAGRGQQYLSAGKERISAAFLAEQDRLALWLPALFGAGIALYFTLPAEPPGWPAPAAAVLAAGAAIALRRSLLGLAVSTAILAACLGFAAADWRTARVAAPVIGEETGPVRVEGRLLNRMARADGSLRVVIAPETISRLDGALPATVRIGVRTDRPEDLMPGDRVGVLAILLPPPGPAAPGAFDFARQAWFLRLGAVGYAVGPLERTGDAAGGGLGLAVERLRARLTDRIIEALPPPRGAVAAALMTGDRGGIPEDVLEDLRDAGLAHLLAISGLHMALFAGALFWVARALLALNEGLALRAPIKKWAAVIALVGAFAYLLVSGASVATQRAFVMFALMFGAVLLDRPAITMRNVALAAAIVLVLTPESVMQASFQMSFAAAFALVAVYEAVRPWMARAGAAMAERGPVMRGLYYVGGIALTTLVASLATAPFAAYHFNRVVDFGLIANLAAMPLVGTIIMPSALFAFAAMPLGLEAAPLWVMGQGIGMVLAVADAVSDLPGAVSGVPAMPPAALACIAAGGLWLVLWRTPLRFAGLAGVIAGILLTATAPRPDILIEREAALIALRQPDGRLALSSSRRASFSADVWLRRDGDIRTQKEASPGPFRCDGQGCAAPLPGGGVIAAPETWTGLVEDCRRADIVAVWFYAPDACAAPLVIDRDALERGGAHAIRITDSEGLGRFEVITARDITGERPWSQR